MKFKTSQQQRILIKLALTPQMRQSIKLLGMSTKDLIEFVEKALDDNPFLRKSETPKKYRHPRLAGEDDYDYLSNLPQSVNPRDAVLAQIKVLGLEEALSDLAERIIYEMDDNGYIKRSSEELCEALDATVEDVEHIINIIQKMEPAGIGARDMTECLLLQLDRAGDEDDIARTIILNHLRDLAQNNIKKIASALGCDETRINAAIAKIKSLNPRPAASLLAKQPDYVMPDLIARLERGRIVTYINRDWLPQLEFYNPYGEDEEITEDKDALKFIKQNRKNASSLISQLRKRETTIEKIGDFILNFQIGHLMEDEPLRSITINEVAQVMNMHASTISRAVANKYVDFESEIISLKSLFSDAYEKTDGDTISKAAIKNRIRAMIGEEDKSSPVSDMKIKNLLEKEGISITRRTVAKYRTAMRILPTHLRKKAS